MVKRDSPLNIQGTLNLIELQTMYAGSIILLGKEDLPFSGERPSGFGREVGSEEGNGTKIRDYLNEKIGGLEKFKQGLDGSVIARAEVGTTTAHHQQGKIFRAEVNLNVPKGNQKVLRAVAERENLFEAIDEVKDKLQRELKKYKGINPKPSDFNSYWERALKELDEQDFQTELIPSDFKTDHSDCFDLYFTGVGGSRIHVRYARPTGASDSRKNPAVLRFHGYTGEAPTWSELMQWTAGNFIVIN